MLYSCVKHVHFKFNGEIYIQCDRLTMGSAIGLPFVNIVMISLEKNILPKLESYLCNWRRYIDHIFAYVLLEKTDFIYHSNMQFMYERDLTTS